MRVILSSRFWKTWVMVGCCDPEFSILTKMTIPSRAIRTQLVSHSKPSNQSATQEHSQVTRLTKRYLLDSNLMRQLVQSLQIPTRKKCATEQNTPSHVWDPSLLKPN